MAKEIFSRYELKYLIDRETYQRLVEEIKANVKFDSFGSQGQYNIVSLYFEDPEYRIYYETKNKLKFRQKLRLRVYNRPSLEDYAFFEIKQKSNQVVNKRRTKIKLGHAYDYLENLTLDQGFSSVSNPQIFREIQSFAGLYNLRPEIVVSYDRQAFQGIEEKDLRITFDYNIQCRRDDLRLDHGPEGRIILDPNLVVLEVKVDHSVPLWLARILSQYRCPRKSFSKYCTGIEGTVSFLKKIAL